MDGALLGAGRGEQGEQGEQTPRSGVRASGPRSGWDRVPGAVRATLPLWLASRVAVALLSLGAARALSTSPARSAPGLRTLWDRWDVGLFTKVARYGYRSPAYSDRTEVDFPGLPLAIRFAHLFVRDWIAAGLVVSLLAGVVTAAALWRLAADEVGEPDARFAVLSLICFPYAVFLFAAYSEGLFLACATAAWLAARRERWWLAGLLGAGAASARVSGIAFGVALVVQYIVTRRGEKKPVFARPAAALALPFLAIVAFQSYMRARTGVWTSYSDAMRAGWHRGTDWPWSGWAATWSTATDGDGASTFAWFWRGELLAVVVGVGLTIVLLAGRRWGEATFVGVMTAIMASTSYYASGIRGILVAFPLYLLLARAASRRTWVAPVYLMICAPVMAVLVIAFTQGQWVD
ncbi:Integral membrane protein [Frankia sp. AiPs1]